MKQLCFKQRGAALAGGSQPPHACNASRSCRPTSCKPWEEVDLPLSNTFLGPLSDFTVAWRAGSFLLKSNRTTAPAHAPIDAPAHWSSWRDQRPTDRPAAFAHGLYPQVVFSSGPVGRVFVCLEKCPVPLSNVKPAGFVW